MGLLSLAAVFVSISTSLFYSQVRAATESAPAPESPMDFKFGAATTAGFFVNAGSAGGAAPVVGGFRVRALFGVGESFAIGPVFGAELDYSSFNLLFSSYGVHARTYLIGAGFPHRQSHPWLEGQSINRFAMHLGAEVLNNSFFIGSNATETSQTLTGGFLTIGPAVGIEYRLSQKLELTADIVAGLLSFASSDNRIRLTGYSFGVGLNYIW
jgi:hypothetical protein